MARHGWGFGKVARKRYGQKTIDDALKLSGGQWNPSPTILEWIQGWPIGWSALEPLAMAKFQDWLGLHGKYCQEASK